MTNTLAGVRVPAAVIIMGNILGSMLAAKSTALYPAMVAIDESTSMLCARVMRGINSMANSVAPRSASRSTAAGFPSGSNGATITRASRINSRSALPGLWIGAEAANLQQHIGRLKQFATVRDNLGAGLAKRIVREARGDTRARFNSHAVAALHQSGHAGRYERNATFTRVRFFGNGNNHGVRRNGLARHLTD